MSIETLTGDEFMHLDLVTHRVALAQYAETIDKSVHELTLLPGGPAREDELDRLTSLLTLRKLHQVRLDELEEVEGVPASPRYSYAELDQLPS